LPPVVEDERLDPQPFRQRGGLEDDVLRHVVLRTIRADVGVGSVRVEGDVVAVTGESVLREVLVELPRLVIRIGSESDEDGFERIGSTRLDDSMTCGSLAGGGVLDVSTLFEGAEDDHVGGVIDLEPKGLRLVLRT
jgi:hypothetical protein